MNAATLDSQLSPEEFQKLCTYFYRKTGIFFDETKRYFVDKRVLARMAATNSVNFRAYFTLLRFEASGAELQCLVNVMTVNETYFFREEYQLQCLVRSILEEAVRRKKTGDTILIWSMPCATGEEPYSLALYLLEHWPRVNDYQIELVGSDIDTRALEAARRGVYSSRSLQNLPPSYLRKYFVPVQDEQWQICPALRDSVEFCQINLHDPLHMKRMKGCDVIFCRNLLIYFDVVSCRQASDKLYDALNPGGFICLGHSESMSRISSLFQVRKFPDAIVYQKPR